MRSPNGFHVPGWWLNQAPYAVPGIYPVSGLSNLPGAHEQPGAQTAGSRLHQRDSGGETSATGRPDPRLRSPNSVADSVAEGVERNLPSPSGQVGIHAIGFTDDDYRDEDRGFGTTCWIWVHAKLSEGYGSLRGPSPERRYIRAHRWVYEQLRGPIPDGMHLHHRCGERACVNPEHLELITPSDHPRLTVKLTDEQVEAIRSDPRSLRTIAADYGVSHTHVSRIKRGLIRVEATR